MIRVSDAGSEVYVPPLIYWVDMPPEKLIDAVGQKKAVEVKGYLKKWYM